MQKCFAKIMIRLLTCIEAINNFKTFKAAVPKLGAARPCQGR